MFGTNRFRATNIVGALLTLVCVALAQQNPPSESKAEGLAQTAIRSEVRRVLLDVVVTDGHDRPISGLQQQDFSVFEDGKPQPIASFNAHISSASSKPLSRPALPPNTYLNSPTRYDDLPLNILLYDLLNTPVEDQHFAHTQIVKFLREKPAGSRFAIFVLGDRLQLLQGFTDDERQLLAAMQRKQAGSHFSTIHQTPATEHATSDQLSDSAILENDLHGQAVIDNLRHMETMTANYFLNQRAEKTVNAFSEIARFVSGLPGRKNLIWLSGSFPATIFPGNDPVTPFDTSLSYAPQLRQAADLLTAGQVAVYPVDIRGLVTNFVGSADSPRVYRSAGAITQARNRANERLFAERATMDKIADDSGGHAFYDTNGIEKAVAAGINDGANYYTLTYAPTNTKYDGGVRKIRVAISHAGAHLAYRRSYLADDNSLHAAKVADAAPDRVDVALRRGAPIVHDLIFEVHVAAEGAPGAATDEQKTQLSQFPAFSQNKLDRLTMQRYGVDFAILGTLLSFAVADNHMHTGRLEFSVAAYDADGNTMIGQRVVTEQKFSPQDFDEVRANAYRVRQDLTLPNGAACLRFAIRDLIGGRIGALEIPLPLAPETPENSSPPAK